jgi:phosphoribosylformylglycinamidine synthase
LRASSVLSPGSHANQAVVEVGPRSSFQTAWSTNAVSVCASAGLPKVTRLELSRRYLVTSAAPLSPDELRAFAALVHDRMTEEVYARPVTSFAAGTAPAETATVPVLAEGRAALERVNKEMGLAFDDWDMDYYTKLFKGMGRDPTNVELFDIAQSNSEHSRHWFFRGDIVLDGQRMPHNLMDLVKAPLEAHPRNSVVAFEDNSSAIRGFEAMPVLPLNPGGPSALAPQKRHWDLLLTAETHNFPCAVAPYPGEREQGGIGWVVVLLFFCLFLFI